MKKPIIKKKFKITLLVLLIVSIVSYVSSFVVLYNGDYRLSNYKEEFKDVFGSYPTVDFFNFSTWGDSHYFNNTITHTNDDNIKTVHINTVSSNIRITTDRNNLFTATYSGNSSIDGQGASDGFVFNDKEKTLTIGMNDSEKKIFNGDIELSIPSNFKGNIVVNTVSGSTQIDNISCNNLTVKSVSSDIELQNKTMISNELNIYSTSGSIDVYPPVECKVSKLKTVSGDIDAALSNKSTSLESSSTSGDISIDNCTSLSDYSFDLKSKSGIIHSNNIELKKGNGDVKINASTISGDINLN
ncbi:MAG: DUF4097 family beta strand repeat-containing protein [Clostridium sp.]|uniref:DUF4097 family beta strand repeat-containing protein n=1 Tax=Clostridium sp. TaxID=1506 RepID=UPI003F2A14D9